VNEISARCNIPVDVSIQEYGNLWVISVYDVNVNQKRLDIDPLSGPTGT